MAKIKTKTEYSEMSMPDDVVINQIYIIRG